ncbi:hypothetical protein TrCOL_g13426 [Triparma columacea]|uniref:UBC core domain-containing protein n=1 Tax=Triparma columacea TaxID=722753 RepID=A0A9W7GDY0_9STRA|nr:hypothetical protein TrCOL_g13426 [Triparma columacea]
MSSTLQLPPILRNRINKDLKPFKSSPPPGCTLSPTENILVYKATISGPPNTPFEGGLYHLNIQMGMDYPFQPPKVRFETKVFHPNVSEKGLICLDTLKPKPVGSWSPAVSLFSLLTTLRVLLSNPSWDDPLSEDVFESWKDGCWEAKAVEWTKSYAMDKENDNPKGEQHEENVKEGKKRPVEEENGETEPLTKKAKGEGESL